MPGILLHVIVFTVIIAGIAGFGFAGETKKIYDQNWQLKGYVRDDGHGTKKIYDKNWNTEGYIRDDKIYDKNWNRKGTIKDTDKQ